MTNNDLLRRLRYALRLNGEGIAELCRLAGVEIGPLEVLKLLKKEDEQGFLPCDDLVMNAFLDGLITRNRGQREPVGGTVAPVANLTNNQILRKLRIALELNDEKMIAVFRRAGVTVSKPELSALFRAVGHRNFKPCGDQMLRNFVQGLALAQAGGENG